jgi:hypothetical protein
VTLVPSLVPDAAPQPSTAVPLFVPTSICLNKVFENCFTIPRKDPSDSLDFGTVWLNGYSTKENSERDGAFDGGAVCATRISGLTVYIIDPKVSLCSVPGINAIPHEDNLRYFDVTIHGPSQSPYEGTGLCRRRRGGLSD